MIHSLLVAAAVFANPAALYTAPNHPDDAQAILAQARAALKLDHRPASGVQATGTADFLGATVPYSLLFSDANFVSRIDGTLSMTEAFDGRAAWERDWNGIQRILPLGDRDNALLTSWAITGAWAAPDSPLTFSLPPGQAGDPNSVTLAFVLADSPITGTVELAPDTHLPRRIAWKAGSEDASVELSDFQPFESAILPAHILQSGASGQTVTTTLTGAAPAPVFIRNPYEPLPGRPAAAFDNSLPADLEIKQAPTGHLLVHPLVGGKDLGWFIFDTGAGATVLSTPVAREAGFDAFGRIKAMGIGGSADANFYRAPSLSLGRITIDQPIFVGIDLAFLDQYMGVRVGGIVGYDLLARCITEFDLATPRIALFDPASYTRENAPWQELFLYERHPCTAAAFEDHAAIFKLDTGAAQDTVTFHAPAVESFRLLEGRETTPTKMGGVGGAVTGRQGTLAWFTLGPTRTDNLHASFATDPVGAFADPYTAGNIGGRLMTPFTLILDYPNSRIAFLPK
jgi:hypothetical protein